MPRPQHHPFTPAGCVARSEPSHQPEELVLGHGLKSWCWVVD